MSTSLVEFYPATLYIWGQLLDVLDYPDGRHIELPAVHNKIQITFGTLLANCVSGLSSITMPGVTRMEVGTGDPGWDSGGAPDPGTGQTALMTPLARSTALASTDWTYLDGSNNPTGTRGPRAQVTFSFGIGTANGVLREVGLFGGPSATGTLGTGDLVNVIRHVALAKPTGGSDFALTRKIQLFF